MDYYTADLHLRHKNILNFTDRKEYAADTMEMDRLILNTINGIVEPWDNLYILGDVALGDFAGASVILSKINCNIFLVPGNHDTPKALDRYEKLSNVTILPAITQVKVGDMTTVLCHYPITEWNGYYRGNFHLYGHTHARLINRGRSLDVGWDYYYKIYGEVGIFSEEQITSLLEIKVND